MPAALNWFFILHPDGRTGSSELQKHQLWQIVWIDVLEGNQPHKCWMRSFVWHLLTSNKSTNQQLTINTANSVLRDSRVNNPTFQQFSHEFTLSLFRLIATDPLWWFFCVHGVQKHTQKKRRLLAEYDKAAEMKQECFHLHCCRLFSLEGQIVDCFLQMHNRF